MKEEEQRENFRILLGFKKNDIMSREECTVTSQIEQVFKNEKIKPQNFVLNKYYIDLYFPEHKLAVEVDEKAHLDRNENEDKKKEKEIKEELACEFIRINSSKESFNINVELGKIPNHIIDSTKKLAKKSLIDKLSSELLKLELKKQFNKNMLSKRYCHIIKNGAKNLLFSL